MRRTMGTLNWPLLIYRSLAPRLTIWSIASSTKSENMISTTGRIPCVAAPTAHPTSAFSEIGESRIRSGPNLSSRPSVVVNSPPSLPTSSPMTTTHSSAVSSASSALRTASAYLSWAIRPQPGCRIDLLCRSGGRCRHHRFRLLPSGFYDHGDVRIDCVKLRVQVAPEGPQPQQGIVALQPLGAGVLGPIPVVRVTEAVRSHPEHKALEECRAALPDLRDQLHRHAVDIQNVAPINKAGRHAHGVHHADDAAGLSEYVLRRHRVSKPVVLHNEQTWRGPVHRQAERLVKDALADCAITGEGYGDV